MTGASVGAPPDDFSDGQRWGFQPLHPRNIRDEGFAYLRASLRWQMRHASVLRFDHIMGLHRIYFIPDGFPMDQGTYVEYPEEEFYAVLSLESHQHQTMLIGEDLGNVPPRVPEAMKEHGIGGMFVQQFELRNAAEHRPVPYAGSLASIGTRTLRRSRVGGRALTSRTGRRWAWQTRRGAAKNPNAPGSDLSSQLVDRSRFSCTRPSSSDGFAWGLPRGPGVGEP